LVRAKDIFFFDLLWWFAPQPVLQFNPDADAKKHCTAKLTGRRRVRDYLPLSTTRKNN